MKLSGNEVYHTQRSLVTVLRHSCGKVVTDFFLDLDCVFIRSEVNKPVWATGQLVFILDRHVSFQSCRLLFSHLAGTGGNLLRTFGNDCGQVSQQWIMSVS